MSVTIKDIAKEAGVSYQTVSKALRGTGTVSEETVQKVKRIAREKGYVPSIAARAMTTRRSQLIAVFMPRIASSFYNTFIQGIEDLANQHNYSILLYLFENTNIEEKLETILSYQIDGMIIFENHFSLHTINRFKEQQIPLLFVNSTNIPPEASHIAIDGFYGLKLAFEHLHTLKHRNILLAHSENEAGMKRIEELKKTVGSDYGMTVTSRAYCDNYSSAEVLENFQVKDIRNGITGIVCTSDYIALPIMTRLQEHHYTIPDDVSVVGFDDLEFSAFLHPPLTTIEQPKREFGEKVFQTLLGLMRGDANQSTMIFPKLIVRGTTKELKIKN
jgi:LacI family transcriptional regulator